MVIRYYYLVRRFINGFMSAAMCMLSKFCASVCVFMRSSSIHVCACRAISKEANSLVDRNCYGLEVEPLAAVMQVEPRKPHQSQQQYNEAELLNGAMPATMQLLLLPQKRQAQLGWQHAESQTDSIRQTWRTGARSSQLWSVFRQSRVIHTVHSFKFSCSDNISIFFLLLTQLWMDV